MPLPLDGSCQAEYTDGFILDETENKDLSAYVKMEIVNGVPTGPNTFDDILNKRPEAEHGPMVRFSMFWKDHRYDVDWTSLPDNARPIRYKNMEGKFVNAQMVSKRIVDIGFGYQYTDENGKSIKEVQTL